MTAEPTLNFVTSLQLFILLSSKTTCKFLKVLPSFNAMNPNALPVSYTHLQEVFRKLGIRTIGDLAATSEEVLTAKLGKIGAQLHAYANGEDHSPCLLYTSRCV